MEHTFWIWYPGDFELYHAMKQNFSRVERGFGWPAFWKSEGFRNRVAFRRTYELEQETSFTVFSNAIGHVLVSWENGEKKYPFGKKITAGPGKVKVSIHAGCVEAFPCAYVQGEVIHSDKTWMAEDYSQPLMPVGVCKYFTKPGQNPTVNYIKISSRGMEVRKKGQVNTHMVFEQGKRNMAFYTTPFGTLEMGISATNLELEESEGQIAMKVNYSLDLNQEHVADCCLDIQAQGKNTAGFTL